ncbi:MAG: hypothetical protein R3E01_12100 [Pirellulaceae bacterium]|nr:hypothetical protein [Planctomycetales bacterium]
MQRLFIAVIVIFSAASLVVAAEVELPVGSAPAPISADHFPDRLHALVWRNWQLIPPARIARVVGCQTEDIVAIAESMGLPPVARINPEMERRGYITIIRRNWHLLPYDQLLTLLDMTPERLDFILREEDFLFIKLGRVKPSCDPIRYHTPGESARRRAAEIRELVAKHFGERLEQITDRFDFLNELAESLPEEARVTAESVDTVDGAHPRFVYSYFGAFGDPLLDATLDPYPDGLLARLRSMGMRGVWLHVVLRQLAPGGEAFPEFGQDHELRLRNLRALCQRAERHGMRVYLYMNEPRAQKESFFANRPAMAGVQEGEYRAMCTTHPAVRQWLADSLSYVFEHVPELGGVFTISGSENLTNCASHNGHMSCSHCKDRSPAEIIAEVNRTIEQGVHRASPQAQVILWDWGWNGHGDASNIIPLLPQKAYLMSVSEWSLPIERGGIPTEVGEYSISSVGPGPRARRHWQLAGQHGMGRVAKTQVNNSNELLSVPFIPAVELVAEHFENLAREEIEGIMFSWSFGGYPSLNLQVATSRLDHPEQARGDCLAALAEYRYGATAVPSALEAWHLFSDAFREYPYHVTVLYSGPQHMGPANLLYLTKTNYHASMVGLPYDDLNGWRGPYPPDVLERQFRKVADGWRDGLRQFEIVVANALSNRKLVAEEDYHVASAAYCQFASAANQIRFVVLRDELQSHPDRRSSIVPQLNSLVSEERKLAKQLFEHAAADSRIGFEASSHYFYVPLDLVEKAIQCEWLSEQLR